MVRSVQLATSQSGSGQRQMRLDHTTTTRRPPAGRSRTRTRRRPLDSARVPQAGQPITVAVVSTSWCSSPSITAAASRAKPSIPTSATALSLVSNPTRGLLDSRCLDSRKNREAPGRGGGPSASMGVGRSWSRSPLHRESRPSCCFQIVTEREEKVSIATGSNLPFSEWGSIIPDPRLAPVLL